MTVNIIALALLAGISIVVPIVAAGILWLRHPAGRKGIVLLFITGAVIYLAMEWGVKEHGLGFLFNHTNFMDFMNSHYIPYLFLVAFAGAVLAMVPELLVIRFVMGGKISFVKAVVFGLGYGMAESVMLVGYRSILMIVELVKNGGNGLNVITTELFLTGYERILIMLIEVAVITVFAYFIEQGMTVRGCMIEVFCETLVAFLPGFFIAFTLKNYYEVYDRPVALILVYVMLTAAAFCSVVVLNSLKYALSED